MRKILIRVLLKLLVPTTHKRLSKKETEQLFSFMIRSKEMKGFLDYLDQQMESAKDRYLITSDPMFKGMVAGLLNIKEKYNMVKDARDARLKKEGRIKEIREKGKVKPIVTDKRFTY